MQSFTFFYIIIRDLLIVGQGQLRVRVLQTLCISCSVRKILYWVISNFLLTEREGRTGEYSPEAVAVRTERSVGLCVTHGNSEWAFFFLSII